jgi:hypothetical protein
MVKVGHRVCNHSNGLGRLRMSCFAGKTEVSLVTVIFGNPEVYWPVYYVCWTIHRFRRMERPIYFEKGNYVG